MINKYGVILTPGKEPFPVSIDPVPEGQDYPIVACLRQGSDLGDEGQYPTVGLLKEIESLIATLPNVIRKSISVRNRLSGFSKTEIKVRVLVETNQVSSPGRRSHELP